MNDFLINTGIPVALYSNMLTIRDSKKSSKLDGEIISIYDFNLSLSNPQDQKLIHEI